jgi:BirA family biotin operon repressor/biotin-[acetyl-CoA-carboxylase] ligase
MTATPYAVYEMEEAASTQDQARRRFTGTPVLVVAARQTAGRGRRGGPWVPATRAVAATLAWRPGWPEAAWPRLTLAAGLSACRVLGKAVRLEWPNDLVVPGGKVGGLLTEAGSGMVAVGLGVNLYWPAPTIAGAAALEARDPGPGAAGRIAAAWARDLLGRAARDPDGWGVDEYAGRCATLGREVTWEPGGRGQAVGVRPDGGLEVDAPSGRVVLVAGEVHTVRVPLRGR